MATGDILSCTIRSDGWSADVVVEGFTTGATYAFGLDSSNTPGVSTPYLTVVSLGYDSTGTATTVSRTVFISSVVRLPYPSNATKDETSSGGNLSVRVALSDFVYAKDIAGVGNSGTSPTLTAPTGWITSGGTPSHAATGLAVTNSSTQVYPKVVGRWAWPGFERVTSTIVAERVAFHRSARNANPVACVKFTATDGSITVNQTVSAMTKPTRGDLNIGVYEANLNITSLTNGAITVNAVAYPWIGDSGSLLDSSTGTAPPALTDGPLVFLKGGTESIAYVDPTNGTSSGVVSTVDATASATPYQTLAQAYAAIQTANTANGRDGGRVRLKAGNYTTSTGTVTTTNTWLVLEPGTGVASSSAVIFNGGGTQGSSPTTKLFKLNNLTINNTGATNYILFRGGTAIWIDQCSLTRAAGAGTNPIIWSYAVAYSTRSSAAGSGLESYSTGNRYALQRSCSFTNSASYGVSGCSIGNVGGGTIIPAESHQENGVCYGNMRYGMDVTSGGPSGGINIANGFAFILNLMEAKTGTNRLLGLYPDSNTSSATNILFWHNTLAGQRANMGYASTSAAVFNQWSVRHNAFQWWPSKHDVFHTDGTAVNGWPVMYEVGCRGNHSELGGTGINYDLARVGLRSTYAPTSSTNTLAGYTTDASVFGSATGNGNYRPTGSSVLRLKIPAAQAVLPYDLDGNAFDNTGYGTAGAYQRTADVPIDDESSSSSSLSSVSSPSSDSSSSPSSPSTDSSSSPSSGSSPSSPSSPSSDSSSSRSSPSSGSSPSSVSDLSSPSTDSTSSQSTQSSDSSGDPLPPLHANPAYNDHPNVLIDDDDPGQIRQIDQMVYEIKPSAPFTGPVTVDLASFYANSEIRYTLTSRNPTKHSRLYTEPLVINRNLLGGNTVIKARIYDKTNSNKKGKIIKITFWIASS